MQFHDRVARDFEEHRILIYRDLMKRADERLGHVGVNDKFRLKLLYQMALDERLQNDPIFYTKRKGFGTEGSVADVIQVRRIADSVIDSYEL